MKRPKFTAFFDGCCEPVNPGGTASFGAVVFKDDKRVWECSRIFDSKKGRKKETSNNVAEYAGFISILDYFIRHNATGERITVYGDSMLVIRQMFDFPGEQRWRIRKGLYVPLAEEAKHKRRPFKNMIGVWIPRDENGIADELSKAKLRKAGVEFRIQPE